MSENYFENPRFRYSESIKRYIRTHPEVKDMMEWTKFKNWIIDEYGINFDIVRAPNQDIAFAIIDIIDPEKEILFKLEFG